MKKTVMLSDGLERGDSAGKAYNENVAPEGRRLARRVGIELQVSGSM